MSSDSMSSMALVPFDDAEESAYERLKDHPDPAVCVSDLEQAMENFFTEVLERNMGPVMDEIEKYGGHWKTVPQAVTHTPTTPFSFRSCLQSIGALKSCIVRIVYFVLYCIGALKVLVPYRIVLCWSPKALYSLQSIVLEPSSPVFFKVLETYKSLRLYSLCCTKCLSVADYRAHILYRVLVVYKM